MAISLDEALGMSLADEVDESIHVDIDTRQITIPESQKLFGVESDADVEVKHIVIDGRYTDGNRDLSKLAWRVVYRNAKKGSGYYLIPSVVANKNSIEMDWLIKRSVVAYKGTVDFILCAFATTSSGEVTPEWNSTLGQGIVLKGLETSAIDIGKESVDELSKILYETVTAKDVAVSAASNATANAENAAGSKAAAASSASAAAESEQAAAESKAAAQEAAERATQAGIAASNAAEEAERSAGIATDAAGGSALNAENARKSALNAQQSANNAAESQSVAAASAASAQRNAEQVAIDAKTAVDAKVAAAGSADAAAGSAVSAGNSASAAARSEQAAGASEEQAAASERAAKENADAAAKSAQAALESKTAAATSEGNAAASAKKAQDVADSLPADYVTAVNDIATLKQQVANITPDDSAIGGKPWSSKNIIDMLCPPLEESGNPVVCYPVAGYALGVKASWEPVQEGTGTPSPENIRPIHGRDSVQVERCGENVIEFLSTEDSSSDIKIAVDAEKNITLNGTLATKGNITIGTCRLHWAAGKTYTMYVKKVGGSASLGSGDGITFAYALFSTDYNHYFRGDTNSTNLDVYIARDVALVETELVFMLQCWRAGTVFNNFKFQIEVVEGTTTPTTYTPYNGQTNTLTLPETVYGGEVDVVTGDGKETWKLVTLDGTERWMDNGSVPSRKEQQWALYGGLKPYSGTFGISSHFDNTKGSVSYPANFVRISETSIVLHVASDGPFAIVGDLKSYLAAQYAAGTPVQICYKLATPVPFTATGAQPIPALAGANTVLTDAYSATVTGRADPIKKITDLEAAVASIN